MEDYCHPGTAGAFNSSGGVFPLSRLYQGLPGVVGGRKLEAERQGAERQDEERATGAERPEVDATRRAWRIRLGRSNLPLFHARRLALACVPGR